MSAGWKEVKPLSAAEYEQMCREVRAEFGIPDTLQLLGVTSVDELGPQHVTQLERLVPRRREA